MRHSTLLWASALLLSTALGLGPSQASQSATTHVGIFCVADFTEIAPGIPNLNDLGILTTFNCEKKCSFSAENDQQNIELKFIVDTGLTGSTLNIKDWPCGVSGLQCGTPGGVTNQSIGQLKSDGIFEGVCKLIGK